jgi:thymidylate synthase
MAKTVEELEKEAVEREKKLKELEDFKKEAAEKERLVAESEKTRKEKEVADKKKKEEEDLKSKAGWEELKKKAEDERGAIAKEREQGLIDLEIQKFVIKTGLTKDGYLVLLDKANIKVADGKVAGVDEAFKKLQKDEPSLFGKTPPASPGSEAEPPKGQVSDFIKERLAETEKTRQPRIPRNWKKD